MAGALLERGYKLVSGGTDNHLLLVDLRPLQLNGAKLEKVLEAACVACNKNTVPGDVSAMNPGGVRLGSPALTSRGFDESDFEAVAEFVHRGVQIALAIQKTAPKVAEFKAAVDNAPPAELTKLRQDVQAFARKFPPVGFTLEQMKSKN